jgi:protein-S-isoprenylcysteine O-methyltransferase Ste14
MPWKIVVTIFAWLIFFCFWIACIFVYKAAEPRQRDKRWTVFLISIILVTITTELLLAKYLLKRFDLPASLDTIAEVIGAVLILSGLLFAVWGRVTLGRFWSGSVALIENQPVIKSGPYAFVRHPIYAGVIAMLWGSLLLAPIGFALLTAVLGTAFLLWKARLEEALLEKHNGEEYLYYYKKQVKGMVF